MTPLIILAMPVAASATPVTVDFNALNFSSVNQGMWGSGSAPGFNFNQTYSTSWNTSKTLGGITGKLSSISVPDPNPLHSYWSKASGWTCDLRVFGLCTVSHYKNPSVLVVPNIRVTTDTRTGVRIKVKTSGKVGLQVGLRANSGSVDTDVQFNANLLVPDATTLKVGNFFNLNPVSSLSGGTLQTNFPQISANLDAIIGARVSFSNEACLLFSGCTSSSSGLGFDPVKFPLVSFNQPGSPGKIKILGKFDPAKFQFDSPIEIKGQIPGSVVGRITVHVPNASTTGGLSGTRLVASGGDDLIKLAADLDGLVLAPARLPGLGVSFSGSGVNLTGDLVNIQMGPILKIKQNFEFNPSLYVNLAFDNQVNIASKYLPTTYRKTGKIIHKKIIIPFPFGPPKIIDVSFPETVANPRVFVPQTSWFGRLDQLPGIALLSPQTRITPTFSVQGNLLNNTRLGIDGIFQVDVLQASLGTTNFGLVSGFGRIGPLFSFKKRLGLFNTPPLFSKSFGLGGFNSIVGNSFLISTASAQSLVPKTIGGSGTSVPEPAPALLLIFGLVAITLSRRKSGRNNG